MSGATTQVPSRRPAPGMASSRARARARARALRGDCIGLQAPGQDGRDAGQSFRAGGEQCRSQELVVMPVGKW